MDDVLETMQRFLQTKACGFDGCTAGETGGDVGPDATLGSLDIDSLVLVELAVALEREFGVTVEAGDLRADQTLDEAAALVDARRARP
jgi:acyl carrier protein